MEKREKFEIPTIAFTEVTMLTTASSTCTGPCPEFRTSSTDQGVLVNQNTGNDVGCPEF